MRFNKFLILLSVFSFLFLAACGGSEPPNKSANANSINTVNGNIAQTNANNPVAATTPTPAQTTNNAETISPVVAAWYQALKTKNDVALRKIYSKDTLESLEKDMKAEGKTSLVEFITETEPVPPQPYEARNEQIQGDVAVAEIRGGSFPNGIRIQFVKENGEWKMTTINPDFVKPKQ